MLQRSKKEIDLKYIFKLCSCFVKACFHFMADEFNDNGFSTLTWQLMSDFDVLGENRHFEGFCQC